MILFFHFRPETPSGRRPRARRPASALGPALLLAGGMLFAAGCASAGATEGAGGAGDGSAAGNGGATASADSAAALPAPADVDALLAEWAEQLENGFAVADEGDAGEGRNGREARDASDAAYRAALRFRDGGTTPRHTLWALAMIHLLPESPHHDREQARRHLATLEDRFPDAWEGLQARVLRELLGELDRTTALAEEGDRLVEELSQTVEQFRQAMEQLKRIDLNRRPVRDIRGDTIPPDGVR